MHNKHIKKQLISIVIIALLAIAFSIYYFFSPVTNKILVSHNWDVQGNGMYNHITFKDDNTFVIYAYPQKVGGGTWTLKDKKLILDYKKLKENREYFKLKYNRSGFISSITDGNKEVWTVRK